MSKVIFPDPFDLHYTLTSHPSPSPAALHWHIVENFITLWLCQMKPSRPWQPSLYHHESPYNLTSHPTLSPATLHWQQVKSFIVFNFSKINFIDPYDLPYTLMSHPTPTPATLHWHLSQAFLIIILWLYLKKLSQTLLTYPIPSWVNQHSQQSPYIDNWPTLYPDKSPYTLTSHPATLYW